MKHLISTMLCVLLLATSATAKVAPEFIRIDGLTASYTATLSLGEDAPVIPFRGKVYLADGFLRVTVTQDITMEEFIALVDYGAGTLSLLYPDTLNGKRYKLSAFDHLDGFDRIRGVLQGEKPEVPKGWDVRESEDEIDGLKCAHFSSTSSKGTLDWWVMPDGMPVKAVLVKEGIEVTLNVTEYDLTAGINPSMFEVGEDYSITDSEEAVPGILPSL